MQHMQPLQEDTFLALLSSQRDLLQRLNVEMNQNRSYESNYVGENFVGATSNYHVNTSIDCRRSSLDMLACSRRFSLSMGGGSDHFPKMSLEDLDKIDASQHTVTSHDKFAIDNKFDKLDFDESIRILRKKRRLSCLGPLGPSFFDDCAKSARRDSMVSVSKAYLPEKNTSLHSVTVAKSFENGSRCAAMLAHSAYIPHLQISPSRLKKMMEAFAHCMGESQKSQQSIHEWDKKMGLKRSHSKTMRLSMRSRKKLRAMMKKQINAIQSQKV